MASILTKPDIEVSNKVREKPRKTSPLFIKEDYWAIWIGSFLLISGLIIFYFIPASSFSERVNELEHVLRIEEAKAPFKTVEWHEARMALNDLSSAKTSFGTTINYILKTPRIWEFNPLQSFYKAPVPQQNNSEAIALKEELAASLKLKAQQLYQGAEENHFQNISANKEAASAALKWRDAKTELEGMKKKSPSKAYNLFSSLAILGLILASLFGTGAWFMGFRFKSFIKAFFFVFLLAIMAQMLGQQVDMKHIGFGYPIWAIALGILISNTLGTPGWAKSAVQAEFYIKTGLVLLGAEILFSKILAIGLPGIFVAWVVTPIVLTGTFWFGQHVLKIASKTLNITISADMSVCGVSAAIATAAACKASKEELTVAVGLSMVFTSVMMIALPAFIRFAGIPEVLGGAWIGGTIDASGAVVAAGAFLGDTALHVAATIKMIQNMLIGVISFFVAYYWATRVDKTDKVKVGAGEIWKRFPKFILGFVGASLVISLLYHLSGTNLGDALIDQGLIRGYLKDLTGWFFCLAFVSIGLSVNFKELQAQLKGGKPMYLYLIGQAFNLGLTLLVAYIMFYVLFEEITVKL